MRSPPEIKVLSYDPQWINLYDNEAKQIQQNLGKDIRAIYHIGSTAIPGMSAKPVIDILIVCENLDSIEDIAIKLKRLNYEEVRRQIIPHMSFFTRKILENISFHLHLWERGDPQINRHVNFKDYLIHHPDEAKQYANLKIELAKKFSHNIYRYVLGKDKLVQQIDAKAKHWIHRKTNYSPPNLGPPAIEWSQKKLIKAIEANLNVIMTYFSQFINRVDLIRIPGYTIVNSHLPDNTFNYVLDADFSAELADEKVHEVTNYFRSGKIPFSWWVSPYNKPHNLTNYLEKNGYINTENNTAMYFDLDTWDGNISLPPELEVIRAKDKKSLQDFALVLANDTTSFKKYFEWIASALTDEDPIEYYVGYVKGKPVVRGLSCYYAQLVGLHWLSTAADETKKDYDKALQEYRLKQAKQRGYHIAVLQASSERYPLYKKFGYKECGVFKAFKYSI